LVVKSSSTFSSSQIGYIDGVNNTLASTSSISNTAYFAIASRISSTSNKLYSNGVVAATNTTSNVKALPNDTILLFGINNILSPASALYSNRQCAFASIGDGLTDTEVTNLNTRVTTFQTALNRNI